MKKALFLALGIPFLLLFLFFLSSPFWKNTFFGLLCLKLEFKEQALSFLDLAVQQDPGPVFPEKANLAHLGVLSLCENKTVHENLNLLHALALVSASKGPYLEKERNLALQLLMQQGEALNKTEGKFLEYTQTLQKSIPDSSVPYALNGFFFQGRKQNDRMMNSFKQALSREPFQVKVLLALGVELFQAEEYKQLIALFEPYQKKLVEEFQFYSLLGRSYYETGKWQLALVPLQNALKINPGEYLENRLLGLCGIRLNQMPLIQHLQKAWSIRPKDETDALLYIEALVLKKLYKEACTFFKPSQMKNPGFIPLMLEAYFQSGQMNELKTFIENNEKARNNPRSSLYLGLIAFKEKANQQAKNLLDEFMNNKNTSFQDRKTALDVLIQIATLAKDTNEQRKLLSQQLKLDPTNQNLVVQLAGTYDGLGAEKPRLRNYLDSVQFYPENRALVFKTCTLLFEFRAFYKLIEILNSSPLIPKDAELTLLLGKTYMETLDLDNARLLLLKAKSQNIILPELPADLAALDQAKSFDHLLPPDPANHLANLQKSEASLMESLESIRPEVRKNSLPPSPGLAQKITLQGEIIKQYPYKGMTETMIPPKEQVLFLELPENLAKDEDEDGVFYLARYKNELHRIRDKYLNIKFMPGANGEMGDAEISNVDSDYKTLAELKKIFEPGSRVSILQALSTAADRVVELDEDNKISFLAVPLNSYTIKHEGKTYYYVRRENLKILNGYEFLQNEIFADLVAIPDESKIVCFGPDNGGISIYDKDRKLLARTGIEESVNRIRTREKLDRLIYRGRVCLDLNQDNLVDYLALWQSLSKPETGVLIGLISTKEGFSPFSLLTHVDFLPAWQARKPISLVPFLKDLDDDGHIEIQVSAPFQSKNEKAAKVPWFELYRVDAAGQLDNCSNEFPEFLKENKNELDQILERKRQESGEDDYFTKVWFEGYLSAMERLDEIKAEGKK